MKDTYIDQATCCVPDTLVTGGQVTYFDTAITVTYDTVRYALSTSQLNGGFHHVLAVRNQQLVFHIETEKDLPGGSVANYLGQEFLQLDIPINFATALLTTAPMSKHAYVCERSGNVIVEAIVTAGYEATAHRAGDGFYYREENGEFQSPGTINVLVFTNVALTDGAMAKAFITITEAKTAMLHELGIESVMSGSPATGTATDGIILTIDPDGEILTDTGTFSELGDTMAKAVRKALYLTHHFYYGK